ncbi:MAG: hypothetical protein QM674_00455 [Burkholderiaceae bacterium]
MCLDQNGNGACDSGEPASAPTDADGRYTITGLTAEQAQADGPWAAIVPAGARDAGVPVTAPFTLRAPVGQSALISPLSTLVQIGVAGGRTRADAEAAVAAQLDIPVSALYRDYVAEAAEPGSSTIAAIAGSVVVPALQRGDAIEIGSTDTAGGYQLADLAYGNTANWYRRSIVVAAQPDTNVGRIYYDERQRFIGGAAAPQAPLYAEDPVTYRVLPGGPTMCDQSTAHTVTRGSPGIAIHCGDRIAGVSRAEDVAGQSIADVVARIRASAGNTLRDLDGARFGSAVFPAGSLIAHRVTRTVEYAVRFRPADGTLAMTAAELPVRFPGPVASPTGANTVAIGTLAATANTPMRRPRAAFGADGTVYYYVCDLVEGVSVNCAASGSDGRWKAGTLHGLPVIELTNQPTESSPLAGNTRVFVESGGITYFGYRIKPQTEDTVALRLVNSAYQAMSEQLGMPWPPR